MPSELSVHAVHQGGMHFVVTAGPHQVAMDYPLEPGQEPTAPRPLELLLSSLAGCGGSTLALLLKRMHLAPTGIEVTARATRRDEHPTVLTDIALEFVVRGPDIPAAAVERALALAEAELCPVWAMLAAGTRVTHSARVEAA